MFRFGLWTAGLIGLATALALGSISLLVAVVLGGDVKKERRKESTGSPPEKRELKDTVKMVEAIANHNKEPRILKRKSSRPQWFPLYPKDYDWKEEERVRKALRKLYGDSSAAVWEACVQYANDRRYCVFFYSGSSSDAELNSVGEICHEEAYYRLCRAFAMHLPSVPPHGCPFYLEEVYSNLPAWRKARKDQSFYQLQIEACELAIRELPKLDSEEYSDKYKAKMRRDIEVQIKELRRTKKPVIEEWPGSLPAYPEWAAKKVREAFEKGSLEDLEIIIAK